MKLLNVLAGSMVAVSLMAAPAVFAAEPGVLPDFSVHSFVDLGTTGWLVRSAADFDEALRALRDPDVNRAVGEQARSWVMREIGTWDDCVRRYKNAYRRLANPSGDTIA